MSNYLIAAIATFLMAGILIPSFFRLENKNTLRITVKGLATLCPAVLCLIAAARTGIPAAWWTAAGLFVCLTADVLLEIWFYKGMVAFGLGHVCYMIAYTKAAPMHWASILAFFVLLCIIGGLFYTWRDHMGKKKAPFTAYGIVLCLMTAIAFPLSFTLPLPGGVLLAAGAAFFTLSDGLLCRNILFDATKKQRVFSLYMYYLGQLLLALGWFL